MEASVRQFGRCVTVSIEDGHEFEFEARSVDNSATARLFAERWKNKRLPLQADAFRRQARDMAERRLRDCGLI